MPRKNNPALPATSKITIEKSAVKIAAGTKPPARHTYIPIEKGMETVERQFEGLRPLGNLIKEKLGD